MQQRDASTPTLRPRPGPSARLPGLAALTAAATFVVGFAVYATVVGPAAYASPTVDVASHVAFLAEHQVVLQAWYTVIYLVFGAALVVLAPGLGDRLRPHAPTLARTATAFALIWATLMFAVGMTVVVGGDMVVARAESDAAQAGALWLTVQLLVEGMGGGIELVGGAWMALVGIAGLRARVFPTWLNGAAILAGAAGIASTALVATEAVTSLYGVASIVWFTGLGVHLVRRPGTAVDVA